MSFKNLLIFKYLLKNVNKQMRFGKRSTSGRNFSGRICVHHRGGANKRNYYPLDFKRRINMSGYIYHLLYDSRRTAFVGLVRYDNGYMSNILLAEGLEIGQRVYSGDLTPKSLNTGDSNPLSAMPLFSVVNSMELIPYGGAKMIRSAGAGAVIIRRDGSFTTGKLPSGWQVSLPNECIATLGYVSNIAHRIRGWTKAGRQRWFGRRPVVRGVAMNPCDHPHGGGEGKKSPLAAPKSPWGQLAKGVPTKKTKKHRAYKRLFKRQKN